MTFERLEQLDADLAQDLLDNKLAVVKRSSAVETSGEIVDAILLNVESPLGKDLLDRLEGYEFAWPPLWFEFVSAPYGDDEDKCLELARNALSE